MFFPWTKAMAYHKVEPLCKGTLKSNATLNNSYHYGVKMITTIENKLWKQPTSLQRPIFRSRAWP